MALIQTESKLDRIEVGCQTGRPPKVRYFQPALKIYGTVKHFTNGFASNGSDSNGPAKKNAAPSDRAAKDNIVRIGEHPLGFGLYLFDYKPTFREPWGHGRQFGVMADEVHRVMPNAVQVASDGYMVVDYAMLGIERAAH